MKKHLIFIAITLSLLALTSCEKYCSCTAPGENPTTIEIGPDESCTNYSGSEYGQCS